MVQFGYTLLTEQSRPAELVRHAAAAERAGFDFEVMGDHCLPRFSEQGRSPYAWGVLGAVAQVTARVELMTCVTCPAMGNHPAVVAQQASTIQLLSGNRFTLGVGVGESLDEQVTGGGWPPATVWPDMAAEALQIISRLFDGGYLDYTGDYFRVDSAKLSDLPETRVPIAAAVSCAKAVRRFAPVTDAMIAVEPDEGLCRMWDDARGGTDTSAKIGQLPVCWDTDRRAAVRRVYERFRRFDGGAKVSAELPGTAAQTVTEDDIAATVPCGPDIEEFVAAAKPFWEAGFTHVALVQIGGDSQEEFLTVADRQLLPALREACGVDRRQRQKLPRGRATPKGAFLPSGERTPALPGRQGRTTGFPQASSGSLLD